MLLCLDTADTVVCDSLSEHPLDLSRTGGHTWLVA